MKNYFYLLAFLAFSFVYAQENNEPELWITYEYTPKKGMNQKFEEAIAEKKSILQRAKLMNDIVNF